ncbi:MAG: hypothetical protein OXC62_02765, partial [Aestuariivita sp.]|nr:hypothetical protein [Aestuariivita sp.]
MSLPLIGNRWKHFFVLNAISTNGKKKDRYALARSFIVKTIREKPTTRDLIDRLPCDPPLRR